MFTFSIKHEIRHFHVVVVQKRERNVQKSVRDARAKLLFCLGPIHTYPDFCIRKSFYADTPSVHTCPPYTLDVSGDFCIRSPEWKFLHTLCIRIHVDARIRIFLYTLTSQYQNQSFSARDLTNPLRCPDANQIRVDGRIRFVYTTCGRRYFCIRIKKFADTKISGYVWTGPYCLLFLWPSRCRPRRWILKSLLTANNRHAFSMTLRTLDNLVHSWLV